MKKHKDNPKGCRIVTRYDQGYCNKRKPKDTSFVPQLCCLREGHKGPCHYCSVPVMG